MTDGELMTAGLDRWEVAAKMLNNIILEQGFIDINDTRIWKGILNSWENEDWEYVLTTVAYLLQEHPEFFQNQHVDAFNTAASTLLKYNTELDRVLDKRVHRKIAWKMFMTLRELWNKCNNIYLPNRNP